MNYYLLGIKGSGMSALACILKEQGHEVIGSDIDKEIFTEQSLINHNISYSSFDPNNINENIDEIIYGNVFNDEHEELIRAQELNIKYTKYVDFLREMTNKYYTVAISGTNGKTTTTSLVHQSLDGTIKNTLIGDSRGFGNKDANLFILEACEYKENFLNFNPNISLINNIEMDHPDFFKSLDQVKDLFTTFANRAEIAVINIDDENVQAIYPNIESEVITYGIENGDIHLENVEENNNGYVFDVVINDTIYKNVELPFVGIHMLYNTVATYALNYALDKDFEETHDNLIRFQGAKRRFESTIVDEKRKIILIDDYAHHPTSIKITLDAIRQKYSDYKLTTIFQVHTYTRALEFHEEFAKSLEISDKIFVTPIFGSIRETDTEIQENIITQHISSSKLICSIDDINYKEEKQVIALLGAGDIDKLYKEKIIEKFKENNGQN